MRVFNCGYDYHHGSDYIAERPEGTIGHILMIIRSPARIVLYGQEHYTEGNCVVLFHQNTPQFFYAHNSEFINDWIRFDLDQEDYTFLENIGLRFDSIAEYAEVYTLSRFIKSMAVEKGASNKNATESMALLLRLLLLKLSDYIVKAPATYSPLTEQLTILKNNIYASPQKDWSIDSICRSMSLSPSYLQHKYKQLFGNCIKDDIIESRIQSSKQLLIETSHTVASIAYMVGYSSEIAFMYMFKKKTGFTPTQYRISSLPYKK